MPGKVVRNASGHFTAASQMLSKFGCASSTARQSWLLPSAVAARRYLCCSPWLTTAENDVAVWQAYKRSENKSGGHDEG
jgi:hypothetical protein